MVVEGDLCSNEVTVVHNMRKSVFKNFSIAEDSRVLRNSKHSLETSCIFENCIFGLLLRIATADCN